MFFRHERPKELTFEDRLGRVRQAGFTVDVKPVTRGVKISRNGCAVVLNLEDGAARVVEPAGLLVGGETGALTDSGYQKFFLTPSGHRKPALASELKALHDFQEDLREALGQTSLYNESLGTVSTFYLYDRVKDRDRGVPKRAWE
ncbi:MAG TPA: hypothetical protein VK335_12285 [Bryobacteraceae bacterium]|nr:hypothetical protein [Bryobacteraceae bacterium]